MDSVNDIYFKTLVMNIAGGLLAGQTGDRKYIDQPGKKKEEYFADDVFKYADAIMKRYDEREEAKNG